MKLWLRVYLSALPLALLVVTLCGAWLLRSSYEESIKREFARAQGEHAMLAGALSTRLNEVESGFASARDANLTERALSAAAASYARYYTGQDVALRVLSEDGRELYSALSEQEQAAMGLSPWPGQRERVIRQLDGRTLLFVSGYLSAPHDGVRVDLMRDISALIEGVRAFARQIALLLAAACAVLGFGLCLLINAAMRPLSALSASAKSIAGGDYDARVKPGSGEVGQLAGAFNQMADAVGQRIGELEQAARSREQFIANLAHEMKTPMTTILGYSDLLSRAKLSEEQQAQALSGIRKEGARLDALSKRLLRLFSVEQGGIEPSETSIPTLLSNVSEALRYPLVQAGVALDVDCGLDKWTLDAGLFEQLLINLVENAMKASVRGSRVKLSAKAVRRGAKFTVRDYGSGIPGDQIGRVLEPFYMVDPSRARNLSGAGLGLTLADAIARAHGGALSIKSAEGVGTVVRVTLPNPKA